MNKPTLDPAMPYAYRLSVVALYRLAAERRLAGDIVGAIRAEKSLGVLLQAEAIVREALS